VFVGVGVFVGVFVDVSVGVGVFVGVLVDVSVGVGVFVFVGVAVFVGVGVDGGGHVLNVIGPPKSFSVAVNDCDDRVCGQNVWMQPVKPSADRSIAPSMNSFLSIVVDESAPLSRQTQPPQPIARSPVFTPKMMLPALPVGW
jgi:hypothetical protein